MAAPPQRRSPLVESPVTLPLESPVECLSCSLARSLARARMASNNHFFSFSLRIVLRCNSLKNAVVEKASFWGFLRLMK